MEQKSELRQDPVTGEWVVIATGRAHRPDGFRSSEKPSCPFDALLDSALLVYDSGGNKFSLEPSGRIDSGDWARLESDWQVQVVPNKYPAFAQHGECAVEHRIGPYALQDGVGFHEVIITKDHETSIADMPQAIVELIVKAYRERYLELATDSCVEYISIFHNQGPSAGATVLHPHSQLIAIPVVPPDVGRSLKGSLEYSNTHNACVHCVMLDFERREKTRIVYENEAFSVFCPFVSRSAFEIRIFPKTHASKFEGMDDGTMPHAADALHQALRSLKYARDNPDYNFFIHTAPSDSGDSANHYHWHIEIIPKTAIWAGFDIGTGIEISTTAPEEAAELLRKSLR